MRESLRIYLLGQVEMNPPAPRQGFSAPPTLLTGAAAPHPVFVWTDGKSETCTRFRISALSVGTRDAQFAAGTQLPWKPQGTRCCNFTLATGLRAKSWASRTTNS